MQSFRPGQAQLFTLRRAIDRSHRSPPEIAIWALVAWLALPSPAADPALAHAVPRTAAPDHIPRLCRASAPTHAWYARGKPNGLATEIAKFRRFGPISLGRPSAANRL